MSSFEGCTLEQALGWFKTIINRTVVDFARRIPKSKEGIPRENSTDAPDFEESLRNAAPSAQEVAAKRERVQLVRDILARLPTEYAEVVRLRAGGASYGEIGRQTGRSADSVRKLHMRAMLKFAEQMKGLK
jgi:RNA polymerase sigma factor (sigma-70 family)